MTTDGQLTDKLIARLAPLIGSNHMETIALGYFDIDDENVESLFDQNKGNHERINRKHMTIWRNKNPGGDQLKVD